MLYSQRNITKVFIGKSIGRTAALDVLNANANPVSLASGEIVVTDLSNNVHTTASAGTAKVVKIIQGRGPNEPIRQEILKLDELVSYRGTVNIPAVEQVTYVGFNGTSGAIEVLTNNLYFLRISRIFNTFLRGNQLVPKYGQFTTTGSATQEGVATGLIKNLIANFQEEYKLEQDILFELVHSNAGAAITGAPTNFTVTKGSKTVTWTGTDPSNIAVGDYVRFGGTTTTAPVYKVTGVNLAGNSLTLDIAWQAATATILVANVEVITAALAAAGNFGIKMTGRPLKFDVLRWRQYDKLRWNVTLDGFGATPITFATPANPGAGVFEEVAAQEFMSWGNEGQNLIMQQPPLIPEQDAVVGTAYSVVTLGFKNEVRGLVGAGEQQGNIMLCLANPTNVTNFTGAAGNTSAIDVLNAFALQAGFPNLVQGTNF